MSDPMAALKKRLVGVVLLTILSISSIILLLPNSRVGTHLQKITLGTKIDDYAGMWKWGSDNKLQEESEEDGDGAVRLVVFGDSWVDSLVEENKEGKGKNWPQVLCEEINCISRLNFAASQPSSEWPALPPTGAKTSNKIHAWAVQNTRYLPEENTNYTLPDLANQIQSFIALTPPEVAPNDTIFILSFGFWDIYDFARLDYNMAMNVTDRSIDEIFTQLNILYDHFSTVLYPEPPHGGNTTSNETTRPDFRVVIPRVFDPTLTPGWLSHRPAPLSPSSIAEQQKTAVYLTERWNQMMENTMGSWLQDVSASPASNPNEQSSAIPLKPAAPFVPPVVAQPAPSQEEQARPDIDQTASPAAEIQGETPGESPTKEASNSKPLKDIFYFDTANYLLDVIVEHQLQLAGLTDGSGLGKSDSPYVSVSLPCVRELQDGEDSSGMVDADGFLVCKKPEAYLWWDAFTMGSVPNRDVGEQLAERVKSGKSLKMAWNGADSGK